MKWRAALWSGGLVLLLGIGACDAPAGSTTPQPIFATAAPATPTLVSAAVAPPPTPIITPGNDQSPPPPVENGAGPTLEIPAGTEIPTPSAPTPTPQPDERLALAREALVNENIPVALAQLEALASLTLPVDQQQWVRLELGRLYLEIDRPGEAVQLLESYNANAGPSLTVPDAAHNNRAFFFLAEARAAAGDYAGAIAAYDTYAAANPELSAYIEPRRAAAFDALGDADSTLTALEAAAAAPAQRIVAVDNRQILARRYEALGRFAAAADQYLAIHDVAQTEQTRGFAYYNAGRLTILTGDVAGGFELYQEAVDRYPRAYESYLALVALVDAGVAVDEFQRGLVDYYAAAYQPGIAAFERVVVSGTVTVSDTVQVAYRPDTHLYIAWSYEGLGNLPAAVAQFAAYAAVDPDDPALAARAQLETAKLYARAGRWDEARDAYNAYVDDYPTGADAAFAGWWGARLTELAPDVPEAIRRYAFLAENYPESEFAPEAGFRAGWLQHEAGDVEEAHATWEKVRTAFPGSEFAAAALVWLIREGVADSDATAPGLTYYDFRARDLQDGTTAFQPSAAPPAFEPDPAEANAVDRWLREYVDDDAPVDLAALAAPLASDSRLVRGTRLWQLGERSLARAELEAVRVAYARDLLASYQLAHYFRDLGLYRSSIQAAGSVLTLSGSNVLTAPREIGRLFYPAYFSDLVLSLADQYDYDPLLQLALLRQESLFESFAASPVGAQGLSQVMPATGDYIAAQLGWPAYTTADLNRPWVGLNFGAFYLHQQLAAFDGAVQAALAAYNAGPGNAARWYEETGNDLDRFLEILDFPETRTYVERIYVGHAIYRLLYGEP